jgi:hypothetical protein
MAIDLASCFLRVKDVERHYLAAKFALERLRVEAERDPTVLPATMKPQDVREALATSDGTYLIRLFAEFESVARSYWRGARKRREPSRTRDLIESIAADREVMPQVVAEVHEVRVHRNSLVHDGESSFVLGIGEARARVCRFLAFLPPSWN